MTRVVSLNLALACRAGLSEHQNESALAPYGFLSGEWAVAATAERQRRKQNRQTCAKVHRKNGRSGKSGRERRKERMSNRQSECRI